MHRHPLSSAVQQHSRRRMVPMHLVLLLHPSLSMPLTCQLFNGGLAVLSPCATDMSTCSIRRARRRVLRQHRRRQSATRCFAAGPHPSAQRTDRHVHWSSPHSPRHDTRTHAQAHKREHASAHAGGYIYMREAHLDDFHVHTCTGTRVAVAVLPNVLCT